MRDLTARLREIVQRERRTTPIEPYLVDEAWSDAGRTVAEAAAEEWGGGFHELGTSRCVSIDRSWDATAYHGRRAVSSFLPDASAPLVLFDRRLASTAAWADRIVFFDLETTGLSGGAGTLAFLAGCGWFESDGSFLVRQFLLTGPAGERAMLDALAHIFHEASLLVTYNGRTFDLPLMEMRWAFHRLPNPAEDLPHFDMLPPARRLWSNRPLDQSCSLSSLERDILGFHRLDDVPGFEIPVRYFHFLRTGDAAAMTGVLEHNRHDLVSLAALTARALTLAAEGPEGLADEGELVALGRLYDDAGDTERAARAFDRAAASDAIEIRRQALSRLAVLRRREARYDEAAAAWQGILDSTADAGGATGLDRQAVEALAIHHEHRARDLEAARRFAERLNGQATGRRAVEARHRLQRLERKLESVAKTRGGPEAAPLWRDVDEET